MEILLLTGIIASFLLTGFFAGAEAAFVSVNKLPVELKKKQGLKSGRILSEFLDAPSHFIATILVGFTISLTVYGLLIGEFLTGAWNWTEGFLQENAKPFISYIRIVFDSVLSGVIILIFIFFSRAVFRAKNDILLLFFTPLMNFFSKLLGPVADLFISLSEWLLKYLFNVRVNTEKETYSRVDLEQFIQQSREQAENNPDLNTELFEAALSLPSIRIRQCLVPRKEIEAIDIHADMNALRQKFLDTKLSKLVVYEKNIDNILGYVHQLALFRDPADIGSILLPIPAVPESMSATDLISKFSRERKSIAWVVDEFGGTAGIITLEDLLEEIFGDIRDEYDTEEFVERQLAEKEYIFAGRLELDYLNEKYAFDLPVQESETLSGLIITQHESIPKQKERIIIDNYEFEILNVSDTRIETVKMKVLK
jgi:CBS domain containing-hemolysin-like protein